MGIWVFLIVAVGVGFVIKFFKMVFEHEEKMARLKLELAEKSANEKNGATSVENEYVDYRQN